MIRKVLFVVITVGGIALAMPGAAAQTCVGAACPRPTDSGPPAAVAETSVAGTPADAGVVDLSVTATPPPGAPENDDGVLRRSEIVGGGWLAAFVGVAAVMGALSTVLHRRRTWLRDRPANAPLPVESPQAREPARNRSWEPVVHNPRTVGDARW